jgi:hypothetical protein
VGRPRRTTAGALLAAWVLVAFVSTLLSSTASSSSTGPAVTCLVGAKILSLGRAEPLPELRPDHAPRRLAQADLASLPRLPVLAFESRARSRRVAPRRPILATETLAARGLSDRRCICEPRAPPTSRTLVAVS